MTQTLTRPGPLALDPRLQARGWIRPGLWGLLKAMSADGLWEFRALDEKRWAGEYLPTGDEVSGKTMNAVRAQAARPETLERFREVAAAQVAAGPNRAVRTYGLARRRLDLFDGRLVADWRAEGMCACGRYLVGDLHLDACAACVDLPPFKRIRCSRLVAHRACPTPDPVRCEHYRCTARAGVEPCYRGDRACCGCCDPR